MRSKGNSDRTGHAKALGRLVAELAPKARPPYDLTAGSTGRTRLAEDTGMSVWAVGRMLRGETLPVAENIYALAEALGADEGLLLDTAGYRQRSDRAKKVKPAVRSVNHPPTPEEICDSLGITHPFVRKMLESSISEAIRLQHEADQEEDEPGEAAALAR
ncbi:helix-turn-helix domain-containing protein [Streptomyces parvulus]|uniref:helix-turn-helix domain-containing protein n=1 Tax=Streptomyces parvulus TaxID=146923 RepID=UPI0037FF3D78